MKSHLSFPFSLFLVVFLFIGLTSLATASNSYIGGNGSTIIGEPSYPYTAEIIRDNVNIRSGPSLAYYRSGQLNKGNRITIVGTRFGIWSKIEPPAGSYAWISMQYVDLDSQDQTIGIVKVDNVRVWAGSDILGPKVSTVKLIKLNTGDEVQLLGVKSDGYYKIATPEGSYYWVSTSYTKPIVHSKEVLAASYLLLLQILQTIFLQFLTL